MILKLFSVYDEKAKAYLPPFALPEKGMAVRTFGDCVNDKNHAFGQHPEDYTLFEVGSYDDTKGKITENKQTIGNGLEFKTPELQEKPEHIDPKLEAVKS